MWEGEEVSGERGWREEESEGGEERQREKKKKAQDSKATLLRIQWHWDAKHTKHPPFRKGVNSGRQCLRYVGGDIIQKIKYCSATQEGGEDVWWITGI